MVLVESASLPLGMTAPHFELTNTVTDTVCTLRELRSDVATVVMFLCNHCPFVKYIRDDIVALARAHIPLGVRFIAISSNDPEEYPADNPENMAKIAKEHKFPFPYLFDETQDVARAYGAVCTPDLFVFDGTLSLAYHGRFEGVPEAIESILSGAAVSDDQQPSRGCSIKAHTLHRGLPAPEFSLLNTVTNTVVPLQALRSHVATVIMFICNHCPFVKYILDDLIALARERMPHGVKFIAISSNDPVKEPSDGPALMTTFAKQNQFPFPYLFDETQAVARAYGAVCTPDLYVFNSRMLCVYHGHFDGVVEAIDNVVAGLPVSADQNPSRGCSIVWNETAVAK